VTPPNWPVVMLPRVLPAPVEKQIDAELGHGRAIHFGKLDFEQDFLGADRAEGQHVHHILGIGRGQRARMLGDVFGGDVTGENNRVARGRHADLLVREKAMHFFRSGRDIDIDAQIEAARALQFVPDQQGNLTRSESIDQNLGGGDDQRIGHEGSVTETRFSLSVVLISRDLPTMTRRERRRRVTLWPEAGGGAVARLCRGSDSEKPDLREA
jgi:hypothetical protein